ncbi:Dynamin-like [Quillaja saponaria]|uniref:Dynamin-like n=1 Tax=Quillaja saponaria TaxID=32244 RepID=A0AAD7M2Q5_QUISA|nr:Dynamin-like [Quillaja saponaria]
MEAIEELVQLSESMLQATTVLADEDVDETCTSSSSTFLNVVALGNVGAGKSAALNSLIGHLVFVSHSIQWKYQIVQDELVRLGEQMVNSSESTRALALKLCREFEDKFLQHITVGEAVVLCQVEKAKEDMLNQLYSSVSAQSTARIEELLMENRNVKRRRERIQKQCLPSFKTQ